MRAGGPQVEQEEELIATKPMKRLELLKRNKAEPGVQLP